MGQGPRERRGAPYSMEAMDDDIVVQTGSAQIVMRNPDRVARWTAGTCKTSPKIAVRTDGDTEMRVKEVDRLSDDPGGTVVQFIDRRSGRMVAEVTLE